ncbi:exodeoxyribonuclease V subunit gamma [soil metagenome]
MSAGTRHAGLVVHRAVRVEELLDPLLHRLRHELPDDPFTPITIVVQSRGMQRWLSHQLAERLDADGRGISANLEFPFPGTVIKAAVTACSSGDHEEDPWVADSLVWPVLELLEDLADNHKFQRISNYLSCSPGEESDARVVDRRAWLLARGIADVFDRYALYRPGMGRAWAAGRDTGPDGRRIDPRNTWQPSLWRALIERLGHDPVDELDRAIETLRDPETDLDTESMPADVAFFGISALPPRHLELLSALARRTSVEFYLPVPSTARWDGISGAKSARSIRSDPRHPLLASCGRLGDDAADLILELGPTVIGEDTSRTPDSSGADTLLQALQAGIRDDAAPGGSGTLYMDPDAPVERRDNSVQVHSCHGAARQAEVLRDVVLGLLEDDPALQPRDVLVMTPDVETFAPLVKDAIAGSGDVPDLPVQVADRNLGRSNEIAESLLAILDLASGRATASQVLDVLGRGPVMTKFRLTPHDLERITTWVAGSGIRWGIDAAHREREGQPPDRVHTWRFGMDRLLLGVAMADEDRRLVGDVVPYDHVEGDDVDLVGKLAAATHALFEAVEQLGAARTLDGWISTLSGIIERCLDAELEESWRIQEVRSALEETWNTVPRVGNGASEIELDHGAVRTLVENTVGRPRGAAGYETGAVTLCALVPMRSIPHKVVCLLGMDDGAFPRGGTRPGFDLAGRDERVGDRRQRDEDRFLFLEALLAARQHLVVTTTGRDVRTNESRPPAAPLAELLDVLDRTASTGRPDLPVRDLLTTEHPLNAFSARNFGVGEDGVAVPPLSFDPVYKEAAERGRHPQRRAVPFLDGPLPYDFPNETYTDTGEDAVELGDLVLAALHPTRLLMERRLGLKLREFTTEIEDTEPAYLDPLTRAQLGRDLLEDPLAASDPGTWTSAMLGRGTVPAGTPGRMELSEVTREATQLEAYAEDLLASAGLDAQSTAGGEAALSAENVAVDLEIGGWRLTGSVRGVHSENGRALRMQARYERPRPRHLLRAWIEHLVLTAQGVTDLTSWIVTRGAKTGDRPKHRMLSPLAGDPAVAREQALAELSHLMNVHGKARRRLVLLFPEASSVYARKKSHPAAQKAFAPQGPFSGAGDVDEYVKQAYGPDPELAGVLKDDAVRAEFEELAVRVWAGPLAHAERSAEALKARKDGDDR